MSRASCNYFNALKCIMVKNLPASAGDIRDLGSILGLGRSPGGRDGNPLQYSCLKNPMDRGAWWATVHIVEKSQRQLKQLSMHVNLSLLRPVLGIAVTIDSILLKSEQFMLCLQSGHLAASFPPPYPPTLVAVIVSVKQLRNVHQTWVCDYIVLIINC